jgi:hypothetical protein
MLMDSLAAAAAIAAVRLVTTGLAKRQPMVLSFLIVTALSSFVLSLFALGSNYYYWWYLGAQTFTDLIAIAVVRELFSTAVAEYPGIETAGKWIMYGAVSVSAVASLGLTAALWGGGSQGRGHLFYILVLHRSLQLSLAVVIISLLVFLSHYPLELRRNIYISSYFFSGVFLIDAAATLVATLSRRLFSWQVDMGEVALAGICFITWAFMLHREEPAPRTIAIRTPADVEMLQHLADLNRTLSRVARR